LHLTSSIRKHCIYVSAWWYW